MKEITLVIEQVRTNSNNRVAPRVSIEAFCSPDDVDIRLEDLYYVKIEGKKYYFMVYETLAVMSGGTVFQHVALREYGYRTKVSKNPKITSSMLLGMKALIKEDDEDCIKNVKATAGYL